MNEKETPHANLSFFPEKIIGMPGIVAPTTELSERSRWASIHNDGEDKGRNKFVNNKDFFEAVLLPSAANTLE